MATVTSGSGRAAIRLHCEEQGAGAPILCIHGGGSSAVLWRPAMEALGAHGRVIAYDRRGCGRSGAPSGRATTIAEQADDAAAVLSALADTRAVVVGRSLGGWIAMELALRHPQRVRALALLEPDAPGLSPTADAWVGGLEVRLRHVAETEGVEAVGEALVHEVAGLSAWEGLPVEARRVLTGNGVALLGELRMYDGARLDVTALGRLALPMLLVAAEDSPPEVRGPVLALAGALPGARLVLVPGGHLIDPAGSAVIGFLDDVLRSGRGAGKPAGGESRTERSA